jgi:hypothetical protein
MCCNQCRIAGTDQACKNCVFLDHPLFMSRHLNFTGCRQYIIYPDDVEQAKKIITS